MSEIGVVHHLHIEDKIAELLLIEVVHSRIFDHGGPGDRTDRHAQGAAGAQVEESRVPQVQSELKLGCIGDFLGQGNALTIALIDDELFRFALLESIEQDVDQFPAAACLMSSRNRAAF